MTSTNLTVKRERERETERQRDRQTDRQRGGGERERATERKREREIEREYLLSRYVILWFDVLGVFVSVMGYNPSRYAVQPKCSLS